MDRYIYCLVCIVVQIILMGAAYLIREYWFDRYGGFWNYWIAYALMSSCCVSSFVVSLYCIRTMVHIVNDLVMQMFDMLFV